jgi:ribonuclease HII
MSCRLTGLVGGLDEAGRAPLAGPVVSSCVVWRGLPGVREKVNDSKLLTEKEREYFFLWILGNAYKVGVGLSTNKEIEKLNIHRATLLSMERAVRKCNVEPTLLLVDGLFPLKNRTQSKAVIRGDRKCFFVACASIVAKVVRDRLMTLHDVEYPHYGWKKNKGYPTEEHRKAIEIHGITPLHRKTFKGVKEYVVE